MEVKIHRFVLAEFNTHRVFSRNSASSRAIPVKKQIARVMDDPAIPLTFPLEQKGMQGGEEVEKRELAEEFWLQARDHAVSAATTLSLMGVHKSVTNRLLEPFMWHTVIVSSTEWENFFVQRCSPLAQPEIRAVAELMQAALFRSRPRPVSAGEWHLPYIDHEDREAVKVPHHVCAVSAARCARVSYLTHDGKRDIEEDLALFGRLITAKPAHASPLEHVAVPARTPVERGNFTGWRQLRHEYGL
jgi:thymidylate synthase ThyX